MTQSDTPAVDALLGLADLDTRLGDLMVGMLPVRRTVLARMGAQVAGNPINAHHLAGREADQTLLDSIHFPAPELKAFLGTDVTLSATSASLLFELASLRSTPIKPLLEVAPEVQSSDTMSRLDGLLRAVQNTNLDQAQKYEGFCAWVDTSRSRTLEAMGSGLQIYGYYSAINALAEAIRTGDIRQTLAAGAELLAEMTSSALELALERLGKRMMENGGRVFQGFCASTVGQLLRRGAGLFAQVLTLPFDIYSAVQSLHAAAKSQGKEAMDHYVNAGFSLTSAALGVVLGVAALAGFSYTGPLGIAAAVVLVLGAHIYAAVRQVDDIDDYIDLSLAERLQAGWLSFAGRELDEDVRNRYLVAKMEKQHAEHLTYQAQRWLRGALKSTVQAVVNGKFEVRMVAARHWKYRWDEAAGELPYTDTTEPTVSDSDDVIDASQDNVGQLSGAVLGTASAGAAILWRLGGGDDDIKGSTVMPNIFQFGAGHKRITGGAGDDQFVFELAADTFDVAAVPGLASELRGEAGSDTLHFFRRGAYIEGVEGFVIDLQAGTVVRRKDAGRTGLSNQLNLDSIENLSTPAGVASHVTGSAQANILIAEGNNDRIEAGGGDDTIIVRGADAWVDGGVGNDRYVIASNRGTVTLHEQDWQEDTLIELGWDLSSIASWFIQGCALVIRSLRGLDGELPERVVRIEALYTRVAQERRLSPHNLRFVTADGYTLEPILAPVLTAQGDQPVRVGVRAANQMPTFHRVLNTGEFVVPFGLSTRCFIERGPAEKRVRVRLGGGATACELYLDYSVEELIDVVAGYRATLRIHEHVDSLSYSDVTLTLAFADGGRLVLADYASDRDIMRGNVAPRLRATSLKLDCWFVLTLRDGVSYRVQSLQQSYLQDRAEPGFRAFDGRSALLARVGMYPFFRPSTAKGIWLQSTPQKVTIPAPPHRQTYALLGRASVYEVWPSAGATIYLSTPGALARTSNASFWQIRTDGLNEVIGTAQIALTQQTLKLGSVTLVLAQVSDPGVPLEQISVQTLEGDRYDVRLDLGAVYLAQLDASRYLSIDDVWQALRRFRQQAVLMVRRLRVMGVRLADGTDSGIHYDVLRDCWGADSDPQRAVASADLLRENGI